MSKPRILFVCARDGSRSLMARAFVRYYAGQAVEADAAAISPKPPNPYIIWAMNEAAVDISQDTPKPFNGLDVSEYNCIVTISDSREASLPRTTARTEVEDWKIPDPSDLRGQTSDQIKAIRAIRYQLESRVHELLSRLLTHR